MFRMLACLMLLSGCMKPTAPAPTPQSADRSGSLEAGSSLAGFTVDGLYTDHAGVIRGASARHEHTGFVLRLIFADTVPQAYAWVNTRPLDNRGHPHTLEHLLLNRWS